METELQSSPSWTVYVSLQEVVVVAGALLVWVAFPGRRYEVGDAVG